MRIFKKVLISLLEALPAALWTAIFPLKFFYRQPVQIALLSIALLAGFTAIFYFLVNPRVQPAFKQLSGGKKSGLLVLELLAGIALLYLVPFKTPVPDHTHLTITPAEGKQVELLEIRVGESVLPLDSALLEGNCTYENGIVTLTDSSCRATYDIRRPAVKPTALSLLFSNGPDFSRVNYSMELANNTLDLRDSQPGVKLASVSSPIPRQSVDLILFFLTALLSAEVLFLIGLGLLAFFPTDDISHNTAISRLNRGWIDYSPFILPVLVVYSLLPVVCAVSFPMELELRESTKWLHALALGAGVNIYDNAQTAFINMSHGPLDALIKSFLLWIKIPTLILRWTVPTFPLAAFLAAWLIIKDEPRKRLEHAILSAVVLELFLIAYNQVIITGQTETCAALFLVLTLLFMELAVTGKKAGWLFSLLAGAALMCAFLSNWRYGPTLAAAGIIYFVRLFLSKNGWKRSLAALGITATGGLAIFAGLLGRYFSFNFSLYFNHFFGFYKDLGEKLFFDEFLSTQINASTGLVLFILIGLVFLIRLLPRKEDRTELTAWTAGLAFIFITTAIAFYLNGAGGGIHYYYPLIIFVWFLFLRYHNRIPYRALLPLAGVTALLVSGAGFSPVLPLLTMKDSWQRAADTMKFLKETNKATSIWTEDFHLFKETYSGETIDMGDYDSFYRKSGLFPPEFNALVDAHFAEMKANPPEVVTISLASSPELRKFVVENNYRKIATYNGWIDTSFDILVRPDSTIQAPPELQ